ncbi:hypothetical protein B0H14DRAFT_3475799 [Mycena olivaceomarginata]|nr:hypothetical protein B0H14DRAFT_3475799 [Mycena olivaceomarginata]
MPEISDVGLTLHSPLPEVFKSAQVLSLATHDPTGKCTRRSKGELYARLGPKANPLSEWSRHRTAQSWMNRYRKKGPTFEGIRKYYRETLPIAAQNAPPIAARNVRPRPRHRMPTAPPVIKTGECTSAANAPALGPKYGEAEQKSKVASRVKRINKRLSRAVRDTKTISVERAWDVYAVTGSVKQAEARQTDKETRRADAETPQSSSTRTDPAGKSTEDVSPEKVHAVLGRLARESTPDAYISIM